MITFKTNILTKKSLKEIIDDQVAQLLNDFCK